MKKTSILLLVLSLLFMISDTVSSVQEQSAKAVVADYLKSGGKNDLQRTMQLLQNHQDTIEACYQGDLFNTIPEFNITTTELENVGSIIAKHIDPSIKPGHITLNLVTDESEGIDHDDEDDHAGCLYHCCRRSMTIPAAISAILIPFSGFAFQRYFRS